VSNYSRIEKKLREERAALQNRLDKLKSDATASHSADSAEQAQERENDEVVDAIGNETRITLAKIDAALDRIREGSYGQCEGCGEPIAEARLEALPHTTRCIRCAA
jgi:DnaK suppressor protein